MLHKRIYDNDDDDDASNYVFTGRFGLFLKIYKSITCSLNQNLLSLVFLTLKLKAVRKL